MQIFGTASDDILVGSNSSDYLNGGPGDDILTGGRGSDAFGFSLGGGHDAVTDWTADFNKVHGWTHDNIVFDGFGNWTQSELGPGNQLWPQWLHDGLQLSTDLGHTMTVHADGANTVLAWDTGDSLTLLNIQPGQVNANWITSLDSYGWVF